MAQLRRFRLLAGLHIDNGPKDAKGNTTDQIYKPGDIIETELNLLKFNSQSGHRPKYEAVDSLYVPEPSPSYPANQERQPPPGYTPPQVTPSGALAHRSDEEIGVKPVGATKSQDNVDAKMVKGGDRDYLAALEKMTVKELQAYAAEEEIDLKGVQDKNSILKAIRATLTK